jgi:hypothetical protein
VVRSVSASQPQLSTGRGDCAVPVLLAYCHIPSWEARRAIAKFQDCSGSTDTMSPEPQSWVLKAWPQWCPQGSKKPLEMSGSGVGFVCDISLKGKTRKAITASPPFTHHQAWP